MVPHNAVALRKNARLFITSPSLFTVAPKHLQAPNVVQSKRNRLQY
jgi:hypothetical protein